MYANRHARPGRLDPASLATSLVITGAMIAGLIFAAPNIVRGPGEKHMRIENIPLDPMPPINPPKPLPKTPVAPRQMQPVAPIPLVRVPMIADPVASDPIVLPLAPPTTGIGIVGVGMGPAPLPSPSPTVAEPALVEATIDPRYANALQPAYPAEEQRAGREARVTVRVLVGRDGRVKRIEQVDKGSEAFFASTQRQALTRWRFRPATRGGIPVEAWHTMTVRFVLDRGDG